MTQFELTLVSSFENDEEKENYYWGWEGVTLGDHLNFLFSDSVSYDE